MKYLLVCLVLIAGCQSRPQYSGWKGRVVTHLNKYFEYVKVTEWGKPYKLGRKSYVEALVRHDTPMGGKRTTRMYFCLKPVRRLPHSPRVQYQAKKMLRNLTR